DEIGTLLLIIYMYTNYPYVPAEKADVEQALIQAKQAILHDESIDGLAAAILEADLRFTQALLD
ncbi:MAG: hypothetical protein ACOVQN_00575, partial [Exiguobacterium sp.]